VNRTMNRLDQLVIRMPKLSPREAVRLYQVSRATLTKALNDGTISGTRDKSGHWQIDAAELMRVYQPRASQKTLSRSKPDHMSRDRPDQSTTTEAADLAVKLARAEAALEAEREKTALLERHVADLRRMLPPPAPAAPLPRRRWWPF
jgi:hypothetical protein